MADTPDLDYVHVIQRLGVTVGDTPDDADDFPDFVPVIEGTVTFTPTVQNVVAKVAGRSVAVYNAPIVCTVDAQGYLSYQGTRGVYLVDLGSDKVTPPTPRDQAAYVVSYSGLKFGAQTFKQPAVNINPDATELAGADFDVTDATSLPLPAGVTLDYINEQVAEAVAAKDALLAEKGQPGGIAALDATTGDVLDASGQPVVGATDADIATLVTDPATDTGAALASVFARLGEGVCNVLDTGNPLTDAIADGTAHPLSERFTTLTDAQQVFPRATALTEQIDRHALQLALDTYGCVIAPDGTGDYRIDSTVYTSAADTARGLGNQAFIMPGVRNLKPVDGATNATWFASGNARTSGVVPNATTATAPPCDNLYLRVRLDGNKGNVTGGGAWGYYTVNCSSVVHDVEVFNVAGGGFVIYGVTDGYTQNVELRRVWAHGCIGAQALQVSLRHRKVTYVDVRAWDNTQSGVFFDHSESRSSSIQAWGNGGTGIEVHNTSRNNLSGLRATGNGGHGILISGVTHCVGSDWLATGNGTAGTQYNDVHFDARSGSYGTSKASRFDSIACGAYVDGGDPKTAGYALFVEDGVTDDVLLSGVKVTDDEVTGGVRVPAAPGKLAVQAASAGSATQRWVCGGPERCVVKAADQTVNNSTTLVDDAELKFNVAAGETWTVDYTLKVTGSDTTADFLFGLTTPTGTSGDIYIVQGGVLASTGGSGAAQLGWKGVGGTLSVAAFASTNPVVVRAVVTAGADGTVALRWAQNTATASDLSVSAGSFLHARRA